MIEYIGKLVKQTQTYSKDTQGKIINAFFNDNQNAEAVVILDESKPVGIITRNEFYQKIGSQFGYTIYMTRSVSLTMNQNPLIVEADTDVNEVVFLALKREQVNLYDPVVVAGKGIFAGVVSIKLFLIELTRQRGKEIGLLIQQKNILKKANDAEIQHGLMMDEKNRLLNSKNMAIRILLDNAGQGFLSFGKDMVISDEYSYECVNIFGTQIEGKFFYDLIGSYITDDTKDIIMEVFQNVFKDPHKLQAKAYLSLLPQEINIRGKNILMDYKIIPDSPGSRIMLILTDVTEKKELEMQMTRERENLILVIKAISNSSDISSCMENMKDFFCFKVRDIISSNSKLEAKLSEIYRTIHTYKGDFSQLCMRNTAYELHSIENTLSSMMDNIGQLDEKVLVHCMSEVRYDRILEKDLKIITDALGEVHFSKGEMFAVSKEKILFIETAIGDCVPADVKGIVLPLIRNLRQVSFKDIVRRYDDYIKILAGKSNKCVGDMVISGDDIYIDKSNYHSVVCSLVHIFKNIVDHGIETMEERAAAGKPREGRIECEFRQSCADEFFLYIRDDGRGINHSKIRNMLQEKNINVHKDYQELSSEELQEILFMDGFSTKDTVDIVSGRGMGLGAIRSEISRLGGEINIASEPGKGTEFRIKLPVF